MSTGPQWEQAVSQMVIGDDMSADAKRLLERGRVENDDAGTELEVLDLLEGLVDQPGAPDGADALVDQVLRKIDEPATAAASAPPRRRSWRALALAAPLAAAAAAVAVWAWPSEALPPVAVSGSVTVASGTATIDGRPATMDLAVEQNSVLEVEAGLLCVRMPPNTHACLDAGSTVRMAHADEARVEMEILSGRVISDLDALPEGAVFSLRGRDVRASAIGTAFSLSVDEEHEVVTDVLEGRVRVEATQSEHVLSAHQRAVVTAEGVRTEPTPSADEAAAWSVVRRSKLSDANEAAALIVTSQPSGALISVDGKVIGPAPLQLRLGAGAHQIELELEGYVAAGEDLDLPAGERTTRVVELSPLPQPEPAQDEGPVVEEDPPPVSNQPRKRRTPSASPSEMLARARDLLSDGDANGAVRAYRALRRAHPKSSQAHTSLVSLGDLYLTRLKRPRDALRSFDQYLSHGGGPLAREARNGRVRAHRALGDRAGERKAIDSYLAKHPKGGRSNLLRKRLTELGG